MRREPAILSRGAEQEVFRTLWRAGNPRDVSAPGRKFSDVRRDLDFDGASRRGRRHAHAVGHGRRSILSIGDEHSVSLLAPRTSMVAVGYGHVPARRTDSHRLQHDEPDAIGSGVGGTLWIRALLVSLRRHRSAGFRARPF